MKFQYVLALIVSCACTYGMAVPANPSPMNDTYVSLLKSLDDSAVTSLKEGKSPEFLGIFDPLQAKIDLLTILGSKISEKTNGLITLRDLFNMYLPEETETTTNTNISGGFNKTFTADENGVSAALAKFFAFQSMMNMIDEEEPVVEPVVESENGLERLLDFFSSSGNVSLFKSFAAQDSIAAQKFLSILIGGSTN